MYINTAVMTTALLLGAAMLSTLFAPGVAAATDHDITVAVHLSTVGVDLGNPVDARRLYGRIEQAAWTVCSAKVRVGLDPVVNMRSCTEKALGTAIASLRAPLLTRIYLETHTLQDAAALGIDVPMQFAAK